MPRLDKSGPMGYGPQTGRGLGSCEGSQDPGSSAMPGRGFGRGFGGGRGGGRRGFGGGMGLGRRARRGRFDVQPTRQEERSFLENQTEALQRQLNAVKQRLEELEPEETRDT
jgi:hypothetical protein